MKAEVLLTRCKQLRDWCFRLAVAKRKPAPYMLLIWAPAYDDLTAHTSRWAQTLSLPRSMSRHCLIGADATRSRIVSCLRETAKTPTIALFCGHGLAEALLGPPENGEEHSAVYDTDLMAVGPHFLFAFCCRAGKELGRQYVASGSRFFLGYLDDIGGRCEE